MAFWLNDAITSEPKRNFRWYMMFSGNASLENFVYALKKVDLPKATIKEAEHQYLNHKFYYPGRLEWNTINISMASVRGASANDDAARQLYTALNNAGYIVPNDVNARSTISKKLFADTIGTSIDIVQIDAAGNPINKFKLVNPFFTEVSWGSLDYTSEDITELTMTVRYDYAQYSTEITVNRLTVQNVTVTNPQG